MWGMPLLHRQEARRRAKWLYGVLQAEGRASVKTPE